MTQPQPDLRGPTKTDVAAGAGIGALAAAVLLATPLVEKWEGKRNDPYRDIVGVLTVCYGETANVERRRYTDAECRAMLGKSLRKHGEGVERCIRPDTPALTRAAFYSFAYNVGTGAFCGSTLSRKARAGDFAGACAELSKWTLATDRKTGQKIRPRGLVNRRADERAMCERGLGR